MRPQACLVSRVMMMSFMEDRISEHEQGRRVALDGYAGRAYADRVERMT